MERRAAVSVPGPVQAGVGNGAPNGRHYNLNIIGVGKGKTATLTGSDRIRLVSRPQTL